MIPCLPSSSITSGSSVEPILGGRATGPPEPRSPSSLLSCVASAGMNQSLTCKIPELFV